MFVALMTQYVFPQADGVRYAVALFGFAGMLAASPFYALALGPYARTVHSWRNETMKVVDVVA